MYRYGTMSIIIDIRVYSKHRTIPKNKNIVDDLIVSE